MGGVIAIPTMMFNITHRPIAIFFVWLAIIIPFYIIFYLFGWSDNACGYTAGAISFLITYFWVKYGNLLKPTKWITSF